MKNKRISVLVFLIVVVAAGMYADDLAETLDLYDRAFDMIWLIFAAALVFFMQAGFAMVETGLTRAKNASNILMKNLMDFSAGAVAYWAVGWAFMQGTSSGFIGTSQFFLSGADPAVFRDWMFQVVFAATAATIVSGAMAERTKYTSYLVYSVFVSALIYPISGGWIWNSNGWLANIGFYDFAGSTVVHSVGGWIALVGAILVGPRKGKYTTINGKKQANAIPGHSLPIAALGVFILWFGWYGFNAGSTLSGTDQGIGAIAVTTTLAASGGAIASMAMSWIWFGKPDPSMSLNGALAGLVSVTAGCAVVTPMGSLIIGLIGGILVVASVEVIDKVFHIDDPVGAISVHGICGIWGTLAVGIFANNDSVKGLFYGGRLNQLGVQALGAAVVFAWSVGTGLVLFTIIKRTIGLRVSEIEELQGLDIGEHGSEAYSGFQIFSTQ